MRLLVDTSVLIDLIFTRKPFDADARKLLMMAYFRDAELWTSAKSYTDIFYVGSRLVGPQRAQDAIESAAGSFGICSIDQQDVREALAAHWDDFEDAIVWRAAQKVKADYLITRNARDFSRSDIPALSPTDFLEHVEKDLGIVYEDVNL